MNPKISPVGAPEVELDPEDVSESVKNWEDSIKIVQREEDLSLIDAEIINVSATLKSTGPRVSAADNAGKAMRQKGLEQALLELQNLRAKMKAAPLAEIKYDDEPEEIEHDDES